MVEPLSLKFRVFTVKLVSVRKFRNFTVFSGGLVLVPIIYYVHILIAEHFNWRGM